VFLVTVTIGEASLVPQYEREATAVGTLVHEALRAHYMGENPIDTLDAMPQRYGPYIQKAKTIFAAYRKRYTRDKTCVLAVEKEYEAAIAGHKFTRRLDLVVEAQGCVQVWDHKTGAKPNDTAATAELMWSLATQEVLGRLLLPAEFKRPWGGVLLNVIPTIDRPAGFMRKKLNFSQRMLDKIPMSLAFYYEQIDRLKNTNIFQYPRSGECMGRYGVCDYLHLCNGGEQYRHLYVVDRPN